KGIPTELYDAARIDGAGAWASLRNVTIPLMSPVVFYTLVLAGVGGLQYFLVPLAPKNGTGQPGGSTLFYNLYLYKNFFAFQDMSYGATLAWVLFAISLLLTPLLFLGARGWGYYGGGARGWQSASGFRRRVGGFRVPAGAAPAQRAAARPSAATARGRS